MIFSPAREMKFVFAEMDGLLALADEVHFDPVRFVVVDGAMTPLRQIEVGAQFAIGALQHVEIEGRGDARAVVVGGFQNVFRFLQVDADDEAAAVATEPARPG